MIVKMARFRIIAPKALLLDLLAALQELGMCQIEAEAALPALADKRPAVCTFVPDEKLLAERLYYEKLRSAIDDLLACLPPGRARTVYLNPLAIIDSAAALAEKHRASCRALAARKEALTRELGELDRNSAVLQTIEALMKGSEGIPDLQFVGVVIKEEAAVPLLRKVVDTATEGRFELVVEPLADGTLIGLVTTTRGKVEKVRQALSAERLPELTFPQEIGRLPFPERIDALKGRQHEIRAQIAEITGQLERFAGRWRAIYHHIRDWLTMRLAIITATSAIAETGMCCIISGWLPADELERLTARLVERFGGEVVLEVEEVRERDLEKVPVLLKNPAYFRPFELFARLLPLPRYTSFDPTPFIGIFFPLFFGMILGDIGYGGLFLVLSLVILACCRSRRNLADAARILGVSSVYAMLFGALYGECFGYEWHVVPWLAKVGFNRRTNILPMLYFAVSVGIIHVTIGLFLGFLASLRRRIFREAMFKLLSIVVLLCLAACFAIFLSPVPARLAKPVLITVLVGIPLMVLTGGLMAPLELLRHVGNIISYARIMAIGLTSVLLAHVANRMAGMTGDVVTGAVVAGLLHAFNIVLGLFAPTIHSLRLHYVEFFSKFFEPGGKKYEPFRKA